MTGVLTFNCCPSVLSGTSLPANGDNWRRQTSEIRDLLRSRGCRATFFVCKHAADLIADGIEEIASEGHEIGLLRCSAADRMPVTGAGELKAICALRTTLKRRSGQKVDGFRDSLFPLEQTDLARWSMLAKAGILYDSTVIPYESGPDRQLSMPRYPFRVILGSAGITEWPMTTANLLGSLIPMNCSLPRHGLPYWFIRKTIAAYNKVGWAAMIALDIESGRKLLVNLLDDCALGTLEANIKCQKSGEMTTLRLKMGRAPKPVGQPCVTQRDNV